MIKSPKAKFYNISFRGSFLDSFASHLISLNLSHDDVVLLPTHRACRKLERSFQKIYKEKLFILPQLLTIADLVKKPYCILASCHELEVIYPKTISATALYFLVVKILKQHGLDPSLATDFINFASKFYTFCDSFLELDESIEKELLRTLDKELSSRSLDLDARARRIMSSRICKAFHDAKQKIHLVLPVEHIPYSRQIIKALVPIQNACIYFHGLDKSLNEEIWNKLGQTHPQWSHKEFLEEMGIKRRDIIDLSAPDTSNSVSSVLMLPNQFINEWNSLGSHTSQIETIETEDEYQEIEITALIVRDYLEKNFQSIGIISDDAFFNESLKQRLSKWQITVNDTHASTLADSLSANLLLLCIDALLDRSAVKILALMKHPLSKLREHNWFKFEVEIIRQPIVSFKSLEEYPDISQFINKLEQLKGRSFKNWIENIRNFLIEYSTIETNFLDNILKDAEDLDATLEEVRMLLIKIYFSEKVRNDEPSHDLVTITSMLEARLINFDLVIIPRLNHPFPADNLNLFFARKEQRDILSDHSLKEGYINFDLSSHFERKVYLLRANQVNGESKSPAAIYEKACTFNKLHNFSSDSQKYIDWYNILHLSDEARPVLRPEPRCSQRPKSISVSGIERLMENPYGYYSRYVLGLKKLEEIEYGLSNREFGIAVHNVLSKIVFNSSLSEEVYIGIFRKEFSNEVINFLDSVIAKNFWLNRIDKIAKWIFSYEKNIADAIFKVEKERKLSIKVDEIKVLAIADRIEYLNNNKVNVIDYKTGEVPSSKKILSGEYPQLPIEGLMMSKATPTAAISGKYLALKARGDESEIKEVKLEIEKSEVGMKQLFALYLNGDYPFFAIAGNDDDLKKTRDYIYLSRISEWFS